MKTDKMFRLAALPLAVATVMGIASCGTTQRSGVAGSEGRVVTLADGRQVVVSGQKSADGSIKLAPPKKEKAPKKKKEKKPRKEGTESITDRESVAPVLICADDNHLHPSAEAVADSAATSKTDDLKVVAPAETTINGEWTIYSVRDSIVTGEERPYVTFELATKRFYGNNGCNYINGAIEVGTGGTMRFSDVITTMMMCPDARFEYLINLALNDVRTYSLRYVKPITYLDLKDANGRTVLVLRRHNMDFLNGAWKVTDLNGTPLVQEVDATMTFDTTDLKIHGTTGCNIFNGALFIDPDKKNSLQIVQLVTTRMACAPDSRETEFLLALESVESAVADNSRTVTLYNTEGKQLFKLVKIDLRDARTDE